jgi:hypothetical protein
MSDIVCIVYARKDGAYAADWNRLVEALVASPNSAFAVHPHDTEKDLNVVVVSIEGKPRFAIEIAASEMSALWGQLPGFIAATKGNRSLVLPCPPKAA